MQSLKHEGCAGLRSHHSLNKPGAMSMRSNLSSYATLSQHATWTRCLTSSRAGHEISADTHIDSSTAAAGGHAAAQAMQHDDSNMNSMSREHAQERAAQAQHTAAQRATAQRYEASFEAKNELALATLTASKAAGRLLLDCLAHAASQRMNAMQNQAINSDTSGQEQQDAFTGIWSAAAAMVCITCSFNIRIMHACSNRLRLLTQNGAQ